MSCPRSDTGPLRFELTGISHIRTIDLIPNSNSEIATPGRPVPVFGETRGAFDVAVRALVEPRMLISRIGQALITEAVDDRGQSLLPGDKPHIQASASGSIPAQACIFIRLSLKHPERRQDHQATANVVTRGSGCAETRPALGHAGTRPGQGVSARAHVAAYS